jgi:hypothetical protein
MSRSETWLPDIYIIGKTIQNYMCNQKETKIHENLGQVILIYTISVMTVGQSDVSW